MRRKWGNIECLTVGGGVNWRRKGGGKLRDERERGVRMLEEEAEEAERKEWPIG
jgi:hypothetical protein